MISKKGIAYLTLAFALLTSCQAPKKDSSKTETQSTSTSIETEYVQAQSDKSSYNDLAAKIKNVKDDITSDGIKGKDTTEQGSMFEKNAKIIENSEFSFESITDMVFLDSLRYEKFVRKDDKGYYKCISTLKNEANISTTQKIIDGVLYSKYELPAEGENDCFEVAHDHHSVEYLFDAAVLSIADMNLLKSYEMMFNGRTYVCEERSSDGDTSIIYYLNGELVAQMFEISNQKIYKYYLSFSAEADGTLFDVPTNVIPEDAVIESM